MSNDKIVDSQNSNLAISAQIWDSGSYILYSVIKSRMKFFSCIIFCLKYDPFFKIKYESTKSFWKVE